MKTETKTNFILIQKTKTEVAKKGRNTTICGDDDGDSSALVFKEAVAKSMLPLKYAWGSRDASCDGTSSFIIFLVVM